MKFFSGFCFKNESELFEDYLDRGDFNVAGFSYGAIKAFEYAQKSEKRVDKLQLFSPAFFQDRDRSFKRMQLISYKRDKEKYLENFYTNVSHPKSFELSRYKQACNIEELEELLEYIWDKKRIRELLDKGTKIEVYLGKKDKIINTQKALDFFKDLTSVYFINEGGHLL